MAKKNEMRAAMQEEEKTGIEALAIEDQLLLFKCKSASSQLESDFAKIAATQEALKRAQIEAQTLPSQIEKLRQIAQEHQTAGRELYLQLKTRLECPEGKEINLETGEIIDSPQQSN